MRLLCLNATIPVLFALVMYEWWLRFLNRWISWWAEVRAKICPTPRKDDWVLLDPEVLSFGSMCESKNS
jgi:hypothetical protein